MFGKFLDNKVIKQGMFRKIPLGGKRKAKITLYRKYLKEIMSVALLAQLVLTIFTE